MKDELNRSYNGGGVVYLLQSELSTSTRQYYQFPPQTTERKTIDTYIGIESY